MDSAQFAQPPPNIAAPPPTLSVPPPNMATPPPNMPNLSMPPPNMSTQGASIAPNAPNRNQFNPRNFFRPFQSFGPRGPLGPMTLEDFDGKRLRKSVMRKTVDYNSAIIKCLENRVWQRDYRDRRALQPDVMYYPDLMPPPSYTDNAMNCVTTRFVKTATNKMRCPIFCMAWTPEGRRLVTGASSGEFTLWNGLTFNFETILQAHDSPVRTMVWSHNDSWMVTGDHAGYVKYWQSNMNNVKMFQAHKEALRGISFSPMDTKFVTCSDDGTLRIWDFLRCHEERILRGHGADVKCVHWHPQKSLIISGSKDNQQPIKLWDPKTGTSLATLHAHKSTVMDLKWNDNGNWLITASRDHLLKLFDLRNLSQEVQTFRGHKKEASSVTWHPVHEGLFSSGGSDGSIMFWHVGAEKEVGAIEQAHDSIVWTLAWHPLGHILCSGSNDHTSKFWTRNRPGDLMRDKYNLNTLPVGLGGIEDADNDEPSVIPGMGPDDKVEVPSNGENSRPIPGLDLDTVTSGAEDKQSKLKKVPYSKPIPRNFQAQWNETSAVDGSYINDLNTPSPNHIHCTETDDDGNDAINEVITHIVENTPGVVPLQKIEPSAIIVYGKLLPVEPGSKLEQVIAEGPEALNKYIASGAIEELHDVMPHNEDEEYLNDYDDEEDTNRNTFSLADMDIKLPPPLPSSKLAQQAAQKSQINIAAQLQNLQNQGLGINLDAEKLRRQGFSDNDVELLLPDRPIYQPYTTVPSHQQEVDNEARTPIINVDPRLLKQALHNVDYQTRPVSTSTGDSNDERTEEYRDGYYDEHGCYRIRFDDEPQNFQRNWTQPPNGIAQNHFNQTGITDNFQPRPFTILPQNTPQFSHAFPPNNYRGHGSDFRGAPPPPPPPPTFANNFRPDGSREFRTEGMWNGVRPEVFRGRGGFGPRMPMRGGAMRGGPPPRGFPGPAPRSGTVPWLNPRGVTTANTRGRGTF